jgi:N-acetylneuraminate synthase
MPYKHSNSFGETYRDHKLALELTESDTKELFDLAKGLGLVAFSAPFDVDSVEMLERLDVPLYKIPSFHVVDLELIEAVCKTGKPLIMSTGMSTWDEISTAVDLIRSYTENFVLLQCTSSYPSDFPDLNLSAIPELQKRYDCLVGYSLKGPDHSASLEPTGLSILVSRAQRYWTALGEPVKELQSAEVSNHAKFRGK